VAHNVENNITVRKRPKVLTGQRHALTQVGGERGRGGARLVETDGYKSKGGFWKPGKERGICWRSTILEGGSQTTAIVGGGCTGEDVLGIRITEALMKKERAIERSSVIEQGKGDKKSKPEEVKAPRKAGG